MEITKCVVKKDLTPEYNWLSSTIDSLKYFLTTMYVYIMKEPWAAGTEHTGVFIIIIIIIIVGLSKRWSGDGRCAWWGLGLPADISLSLSGHQRMFHQHHVCVIRWVCKWLPFIQRVVTVIFKNINGNATSVYHSTSSTCLHAAYTGAVNQASPVL